MSHTHSRAGADNWSRDMSLLVATIPAVLAFVLYRALR